jgi:hypothetical protein
MAQSDGEAQEDPRRQDDHRQELREQDALSLDAAVGQPVPEGARPEAEEKHREDGEVGQDRQRFGAWFLTSGGDGVVPRVEADATAENPSPKMSSTASDSPAWNPGARPSTRSAPA